MSEIDRKAIHIWMPDMRSLCDRRARGRYPRHDEMTDEEFDTEVREQTTAPVCGACIVVASHIRREAGLLIAQALTGDREIFPETAADAYRFLDGTRWMMQFDAEPPADLAQPTYYRDCIVDFYTEAWLSNAAKDEASKRDALRTELTEHRNAWRAAEATPADE